MQASIPYLIGEWKRPAVGTGGRSARAILLHKCRSVFLIVSAIETLRAELRARSLSAASLRLVGLGERWVKYRSAVESIPWLFPPLTCFQPSAPAIDANWWRQAHLRGDGGIDAAPRPCPLPPKLHLKEHFTGTYLVCRRTFSALVASGTRACLLRRVESSRSRQVPFKNAVAGSAVSA